MSLNDYSEIKIADGIKTIYPPILCCFGITGNGLAIAVLVQKDNRRTSTGVLLIALAVTDTLVLILSVVLIWLGYVFKIDFRGFSSACCKILTFMTYFAMQMSAWILVLITLERMLSVLLPYTVKKLITRKRVTVALVILTCALMTLNSHILYGVGLEINAAMNKTVCKPTHDHEDFFFTVWSWIDFGTSFALPAVVFVIGNVVIISRLKSSNRYRRRLISGERKDSYGSKLRHVLKRHVKFFTRMTLLFNTTFVCLVAPFSIFAIGQPYWFPFEKMTVHRHAVLTLIGTVLLMLLYTNNAINFLLYVLGGSKFRGDFMRLGLCGRKLYGATSDLSTHRRSAYLLTSNGTEDFSRIPYTV